MRLFSERQTDSENLSFSAICLSLVGVVSCLSSFFPLLSLFAVLFLPLVGAVESYCCKPRYIVAFALGAGIIGPLLGAYSVDNVLFFVLPSVYAGLSYGYGLRKGMGDEILVFVSSLVETILFFASVAFIYAVYGIDMRKAVFSLLGKDDEAAYAIFPLFGFAYSLCQAGISHLIIYNLGSRMSMQMQKGLDISSFEDGFAILMLSACFGIAYLDISAAYLCFGLGAYFAFYSLRRIVKGRWLIATAIALCAIAMLASAYLYSRLPENAGMISFALFLLPLPALSLASKLIDLAKKPAKGHHDDEK